MRPRTARENELPYSSSPPVQFVYRSTAPLSAGAYQWNDAPSALYFPISGPTGATLRKILNTTMYYVRDITMTADIDEMDYTVAISPGSASPLCIPYLTLHLDSRGMSSLFREPFLMPKFLQNFGYKHFFEVTQTPDQLRGSFHGTLIQTPALIGKTSITLTAIMSVQEVTDQEYMKAFKIRYSREALRE